MFKKIKQFFSKAPLFFQYYMQTRQYPGQETEMFYGKVIEPGEKYDLVFQDVGETKNLTVSAAVRQRVASNSTLKAIVEIYQTLLVKEWQWVGDEHNVNQINNYLSEEMFGSVHGLQAFIKRAIYFYVAEIGIAIYTRWVPDPETGSEKPVWELIPSLDLIFTYKNEEGQHDPFNGTILIIGRRVKDHSFGSYNTDTYSNRIEVLYDESRTAEENMNFTYLPTTPLGNVVFGTSKLAAVLAPALGKQRITDLINKYLSGKIDPYKIYISDLTDLIKEGVTPSQIAEHLKNANASLDDANKKRETGKNLISPFKIEVLDISGLEKDSVDGIETFLELYEPEIVRASGVPEFMLGGQRKGNALGSRQSDSARILFDRRLETGVLDINEVFSEAIMPVASYLGISEKMMFSAAYDDTEIQKLRGEIVKQRIENLTAAVASNFIEQGTAKEMLAAGSYDFGKFMKIKQGGG